MILNSTRWPHAKSKQIFQDNSLGGKYNITGFYANNFGTFYQSCGNCLNQAKRNATIQNVVAIDGIRMGIVSSPSSPLSPPSSATYTLQINPNFGDEFRLKDSHIEDVETVITKEIGNNVQTVPIHMGDGPDEVFARYNLTRDNIIESFDGSVEFDVYEPEEPYDWLEEFWPDGFWD